MPRAKEIDIDPDAVDADGLADNNSSAGATVTLDGALTSGGTFTAADGLARQLVILDTGADVQTGATYTVTGTDAHDKPQVESLAGPGASASVETLAYFKTVTSIAIASPVATSTVDIGTVDQVASPRYVLNHYSQIAPTVSVTVNGTINFTVQETFNNPFGIVESNITWHDVSALASKTAVTTAPISLHSRATRVIINSYSTGADLKAIVIQTRNP